jgi:hypothetical protein
MSHIENDIPVSDDERPTINLDAEDHEHTHKQEHEQDPELLFDAHAVQNSLKRSFLTTLIVGGTVILARPSLGLGGISAMFIVCGVMVSYWLFQRNRSRINESVVARSVFGDSFYYLGFLFTFIALVAVMIELGSDDFDIDSIIGSMGPALITTVFGMAVRIYLTQFDPITSEPELETFNAVGELSSAIMAATDKMQTAMEAVTRSAQEATQGMLDTNQALIDENMKANKLAMEKTVRDSQDAIAAIKGGAEEELKTFSKEIKNSRVGETSKKLSEIVDMLSGYEEIAGQLREFSEKVLGSISEDLNAALDGVSTAASTLEKRVKTAEKSTENVESANQALTKAYDAVAEKLRSTEKLQISAEGVQRKVDDVESEIKKLTTKLVIISESMDQFRNDTISQANLFEIAIKEVMSFIKSNR